MPSDAPVPIGQVVGVWGLKGHVKVSPSIELTSPFEPGHRIRMGEEWHQVEHTVWQKGRPYIKFEGIDSPEQAKGLQWKVIEAWAGDLVLSEGEYHESDILGLRVETLEGEDLGQIGEILHMPAHDVWVVGTIMIPAVEAFVKDVDLEAGVVKVALIEGMR